MVVCGSGWVWLPYRCYNAAGDKAILTEPRPADQVQVAADKPSITVTGRYGLPRKTG